MNLSDVTDADGLWKTEFTDVDDAGFSTSVFFLYSFSWIPGA